MGAFKIAVLKVGGETPPTAYDPGWWRHQPATILNVPTKRKSIINNSI
jgi:hypothetical protein